jgi:hypothetical protein
MKIRTAIQALALLGGIIFCTLLQEAQGQTLIERIQVQAGPEDMVLDTSHTGPRLLISCCARREVHKPYGEMISLDLTSGKNIEMKRINEPEDILFRPHGIYLDGDLLYVISHEKEPDYHPVLIYRVRGEELSFVDLVNTDKQHSPNALVTGSNGEIYLVNDSGKRGSLWEKILRLKRANLVKLFKDKEGIWQGEVVADKLAYPAGINRLGDRLFVGDAVLHQIRPYMITPEGLIPTGAIKGLKGNDNIRIYQGQLLTPGHVKPMKFIGHAKKPEKLSPVDVFLANPETGEHRVLYSTNGESISGGSTAIIWEKHLYICQVFDPWILKVELDR